MTNCKSRWLRLLELIGLRLEDVAAPVTDPGTIDTTWCNHTWSAPYDDDQVSVIHTCDLELAHPGAEHVCACGDRLLTCTAVRRLLRILKLPPAYDTCTWPEGGVCPHHDLGRPLEPGRDCTGTCTNCNSTIAEHHVPSCHHYNPNEARTFFAPPNRTPTNDPH